MDDRFSPEQTGEIEAEGAKATTLEGTLLERAYEAMEKKQYRKALRFFKEALEKLFDMKSSQRSVILTELGLLSYWLADYPAAKTYLEEALELHDDNDRAHLFLGRVFLAEYNFTNARRQFTAVKHMTPQASLGLCHIAIRMRDVSLAKEYLRNAAAKISPKDPEFKLMQAYAWLLTGDYRGAEMEAEKLIKEFEHDLHFLIVIAEIFVTTGSYGRAKSVLRKIEQISPDNDQMLGLLAHCAFSQEEYDAAKNYVNRALNINPLNNYAKTIEMKLFMREGRYEEAEIIGREILKQSPDYSLGHTNLGDVYFLQGRYDEARHEYRETNQPNTETKGAKLRQARVLFVEGRLPDAARILEELIGSHHSYYDDAMCDLVLIYDKLGDEENKDRIIKKMDVRKGFYQRIQRTLEMLGE